MSDDGGDDGESKKVRESSRGEKRGKKTTHFALVSSITSPSSQARSTGTVRLEEGEESAVASAAAAAGGGAKKRTAGGEKVEAETTAVTAKATDAAAVLSSERLRCQRCCAASCSDGDDDVDASLPRSRRSESSCGGGGRGRRDALRLKEEESFSSACGLLASTTTMERGRGRRRCWPPPVLLLLPVAARSRNGDGMLAIVVPSPREKLGRGGVARRDCSPAKKAKRVKKPEFEGKKKKRNSPRHRLRLGVGKQSFFRRRRQGKRRAREPLQPPSAFRCTLFFRAPTLCRSRPLAALIASSSRRQKQSRSEPAFPPFRKKPKIRWPTSLHLPLPPPATTPSRPASPQRPACLSTEPASSSRQREGTKPWRCGWCKVRKRLIKQLFLFFRGNDPPPPFSTLSHFSLSHVNEIPPGRKPSTATTSTTTTKQSTRAAEAGAGACARGPRLGGEQLQLQREEPGRQERRGRRRRCRPPEGRRQEETATPTAASSPASSPP